MAERKAKSKVKVAHCAMMWFVQTNRRPNRWDFTIAGDICRQSVTTGSIFHHSLSLWCDLCHSDSYPSSREPCNCHQLSTAATGALCGPRELTCFLAGWSKRPLNWALALFGLVDGVSHTVDVWRVILFSFISRPY